MYQEKPTRCINAADEKPLNLHWRPKEKIARLKSLVDICIFIPSDVDQATNGLNHREQKSDLIKIDSIGSADRNLFD
jgi:hypothetical protein